MWSLSDSSHSPSTSSGYRGTYRCVCGEVWANNKAQPGRTQSCSQCRQAVLPEDLEPAPYKYRCRCGHQWWGRVAGTQQCDRCESSIRPSNPPGNSTAATWWTRLYQHTQHAPERNDQRRGHHSPGYVTWKEHVRLPYRPRDGPHVLDLCFEYGWKVILLLWWAIRWVTTKAMVLCIPDPNERHRLRENFKDLCKKVAVIVFVLLLLEVTVDIALTLDYYELADIPLVRNGPWTLGGKYWFRRSRGKFVYLGRRRSRYYREWPES